MPYELQAHTLVEVPSTSGSVLEASQVRSIRVPSKPSPLQLETAHTFLPLAAGDAAAVCHPVSHLLWHQGQAAAGAGSWHWDAGKQHATCKLQQRQQYLLSSSTHVWGKSCKRCKQREGAGGSQGTACCNPYRHRLPLPLVCLLLPTPAQVWDPFSMSLVYVWNQPSSAPPAKDHIDFVRGATSNVSADGEVQLCVGCSNGDIQVGRWCWQLAACCLYGTKQLCWYRCAAALHCAQPPCQATRCRS